MGLKDLTDHLERDLHFHGNYSIDYDSSGIPVLRIDGEVPLYSMPVNIVEPEERESCHFLKVPRSMDGISKSTTGIFPKKIIIDEFEAIPKQCYPKTEFFWGSLGKVIIPEIKQVIFNPPATIIEWSDKTKTIVKCTEDDDFSEEKGFAMAVLKKIYGGRNQYLKVIKNAKRPLPKLKKKEKEKGPENIVTTYEIFGAPFKATCNITIPEPKNEQPESYKIEQKPMINKDLYKKYQDLED